MHCLRERFLAYFALQFGEVVRDGDSVDSSLDSTANPVLQAAYVHEFTTSFTIARAYQWIGLDTLLTEAYLALPFDLLSDFVDFLAYLQKRGFLEHSSSLSVLLFNDLKLHPSQSDRISNI